MTSSVPPDKVYPWQATAWQQLWQARQQGRFAHAFLFVGIGGLGKKQFAQTLGNALLCSQPSEAGGQCGSCHACHMAAAKSHPDLMMIEPEEDSKTITIDQIRQVVKNVNETSMQGGYRVIIIHPATAMNINAANALLKTLEEPTPNTVIILVSDQGSRLPATIISRCQKITFTKPSQSEAVNWLRSQLPNEKVDLQLLLKLAEGAPLKALLWADKDLFTLRKDLYHDVHALTEGAIDPLQLAAKWQELDQLCVVDLLLSWLTDLLRFKLTQDESKLVNSDYRAEIVRVSVALLKNNLLAYIDEIQAARANLVASYNLNKQLVIENVLIKWAQYVSR